MGPSTTLPDALAGRDPSQLIAAEQLRGSGGESITAALLGLNARPTMAGAFTAPPGNIEFFRHLTAAARRAIVRRLLRKQHGEMRRLILLVERGPQREGRENSGQAEYASGETLLGQEEGPVEEGIVALADDVGGNGLRYQRERERLATAVRMLYLLEEMLAMQDYTFSRMGTFAKG
jgi:hypothetical protein